jgi:hypothetical protein
LGTASSEICDDGIDNDCDGTVDEGCSLLPNGSTCAGSSECASGFCVDGVCCDTSCSGTCEACSAAYTGVSSGNCGFIHNGTDPENECSGGTACNGTGGCQECVPFSLDIMECGLCSEGTRTRACTVDGTWGPWGSCVGEFPPGTFCP